MSKESVLKDLQSQVGEETHVSDWVEIDQERINQFADATGDHQWIHVDVERAKKESPYDGPIAHGFLTLSMLPMLTGSVSEEKPAYPGLKLAVNYGLNRVRFPAPVPAGSRIRARSTLKEVTEVKGGLQVIREVTVDVEGSEKPACFAETVSRLYF
ncbi:MAG: MaoC family dehydratase [Longimicrobiales bacterium]|nr:MaoC family dehydratase [Longimicrobiales bacterium]